VAASLPPVNGIKQAKTGAASAAKPFRPTGKR